MCKGDLQGCYTDIPETGSSVNDYFILSNDLYALIHSTSVNFVSLDVLNRITYHLHSVLYFQRKMCAVMKFLSRSKIIERFVWDDVRAQTFTSLMCTDETCAILDEAISLIDLDIDKTLEIFNNCSKEKAECMKKQIRIKKWEEARRMV